MRQHASPSHTNSLDIAWASPPTIFKGFTGTIRLRKTRQASDLFHRIILAQSVAIHHRAAKDRPASRPGKFTHEQAQKRIVNEVRRFILDKKAEFNRDIRLRRSDRFEVNFQRTQECVNVNCQEVEIGK